MLNIMVDIETDGPAPGLFSMISLGAVIVEPSLSKTFYGKFKPISEKWQPEALMVSGHSREECLSFPDPKEEMQRFADWVEEHKKKNQYSIARFWADNNGFDFAFVNWYFHNFTGFNPFGWSSANLNSVFKGMCKDMRANYGHLKKTPHTHHPVDDAKGNAEALLAMVEQMGLKI